jgi:hypothetical protein
LGALASLAEGHIRVDEIQHQSMMSSAASETSANRRDSDRLTPQGSFDPPGGAFAQLAEVTILRHEYESTGPREFPDLDVVLRCEAGLNYV